MSTHRVHYAGLGDTLQARCACGRRSPIGTRSDCEMWQAEHVYEVQRIRAHLGTRSPTLKSTAAWFSAQAADESNPPEDRVLWRQLADEVDGFLVIRDAPMAGQEPLF